MIQTGQFYKDIYSAVKVTEQLLGKSIGRSISPNEIIKPKIAQCAPTSVVEDILDNETLFANTLKCVYAEPTTKEAAETAKILLENESVRLAIIVYARTNGVNLEDKDLDVLRDFALNTQNSDSYALVDHGVERLKEEYGVDKAKEMFKNMQNGKVCIKTKGS